MGGSNGSWGMALIAGSELDAIEAAVRQALRSADVQVVPGCRVPHVAVRVPADTPQRWRATVAALGPLASASNRTVLTAAPRSRDRSPEARYAHARALLLLATRLPTPRRVLDVDELLVYDVLATAKTPARATIVRSTLGPVLREPGGAGRRLLATLDALHWQGGSAKAAARTLGVHVKTVHNRLHRIEELTGLHLDHPPDRMRIEVALYLLRSVELGA